MNPNSFIGKQVAGNYEIMSFAGAGGMGTVFKARQLGLDRLVAFKLLNSELISDEEALQRFEREAKLISTLSQQHIAGFYAYGILDNSLPYIVMEWLDGVSLQVVLQSEAKLAVKRTISIAGQLADALSYSHSKGIIHRDLKPANIFLLNNPEPDFVKILDFGLARLSVDAGGENQKLTKTGTLLGTPQYMSPEHCRGRNIDERSDIYSLSCIIYEMLCGHPPFLADNAIALVYRHLNDMPVPLSAVCAQVLPASLEPIINKCLEKDPDKRYQSMAELASDLRSVEGQTQVIPLIKPLESKVRSKSGFGVFSKKGLGWLFLPALVCGSCSFLFLAYSDWGKTTLASVLLSFDRTDKTLLFCQKLAEEMHKHGKDPASNLIDLKIDKCLKERAANERDYLSLRINFARKLLHSGFNYSSGVHAVKCLRLIINSAKSDQVKACQLIEDTEDAAEIVLASDYLPSKNDTNAILNLACLQALVLEQQEKDKLLLLVSRLAARFRFQSESEIGQILRCLSSLTVVMARRSNYTRLEECFAQYKSIANKQRNRQPELSCMLSELAFELHNKNKKLASDFWRQAVESYRLSEKGLSSSQRGQCCRTISRAARALGDTSSALDWAKQGLELSDLHLGDRLYLITELMEQYLNQHDVVQGMALTKSGDRIAGEMQENRFYFLVDPVSGSEVSHVMMSAFSSYQQWRFKIYEMAGKKGEGISALNSAIKTLRDCSSQRDSDHELCALLVCYFDFYSGSKTPEKAIKALDEAANSRVNDDYKLRLRLDGLVYALSFESPEKLKSRIRAIADDSKSVQHVEKFIDIFDRLLESTKSAQPELYSQLFLLLEEALKAELGKGRVNRAFQARLLALAEKYDEPGFLASWKKQCESKLNKKDLERVLKQDAEGSKD